MRALELEQVLDVPARVFRPPARRTREVVVADLHVRRDDAGQRGGLGAAEDHGDRRAAEGVVDQLVRPGPGVTADVVRFEFRDVALALIEDARFGEDNEGNTTLNGVEEVL